MREAIRVALGGAADETGAMRQESPELPERSPGVFVTLHNGGVLRGCIGVIRSGASLAQTAARCAIAAATQDERFTPLTLEELDQCSIEISLLSDPRPVAGPQEIIVGRHGIVVSDGCHRGLLLPQVAGEQSWDSERFLSETCRKAGLRPDAWKKGLKIEVFEAEVFSEGERKGTKRPGETAGG